MSEGGICCGTAPSLLRIAPPMPPILNLRPLRSATDLISLRYQPPICTPTLPTGNCTMLYCLNTSRISCRPPPSNIQAYCWRGLRPHGIAGGQGMGLGFAAGEGDRGVLPEDEGPTRGPARVCAAFRRPGRRGGRQGFARREGEDVEA